MTRAQRWQTCIWCLAEPITSKSGCNQAQNHSNAISINIAKIIPFYNISLMRKAHINWSPEVHRSLQLQAQLVYSSTYLEAPSYTCIWWNVSCWATKNKHVQKAAKLLYTSPATWRLAIVNIVTSKIMQGVISVSLSQSTVDRKFCMTMAYRYSKNSSNARELQSLRPGDNLLKSMIRGAALPSFV